MGCHNSIGATIDKTFSFPRKVDEAAGWDYINLKGMIDAPNIGEQKGEIVTYLERVGGGNEFRSNLEMQVRWFKADGTVDYAKLATVKDVHDLIVPSAARALLKNNVLFLGAMRRLCDWKMFIPRLTIIKHPPSRRIGCLIGIFV